MVVIESLSVLIIYFSVFAFLGWIGESIYRSLKEKKIVSPGFLFGPFVPIYGFGAVGVYLCSFYLRDLHFPLLLVIYFFIPLLIEYSTSYFAEKIFGLRFWDYSNYRFNINGRVCLRLGMVWFLLVIITIFFIQPFLIEIIAKIPPRIIGGLSIILIVYFSIDTIYSARLYYHFSKFRKRLKHFIESEAKGNIESFFRGNPKLLKMGDILKPFKTFPYLRKKTETNKKRFLEKIKELKKIKKKILRKKR